MRTNTYKIFAFEAAKITAFCLAVAGILVLLGANQNTILVVFNMAVLSCAATFSPEKKQMAHVFQGSLVIVASILLGGVLGYYVPWLAKITIILYAMLAFLVPKTKPQTNIFVTGAVMFLIFASLPFDVYKALHYALYSLVPILMLLAFYWLFDRKIYKEELQATPRLSEARTTSALMVGLALSGAWLVSYQLKLHTSFTHLYWIGLTALVVIQSAQQKTIKTSLVRIGVNTFGALVIVLLMTYVIPQNFWINFTMLTLFLFLIFALGFSYVGRTLFIELFVLGFTHILGQYHNLIAFDRVILTLIGGLLVILATFISFWFLGNSQR